MTHPARSEFQVPARLAVLIARNRRSHALRMLDQIIGSDYGFFREDLHILRTRQAALQFKVDLLLEWGRYTEALAWLCLETEVNAGNVFAQAMKKRLKRSLHIDDLAHAQLHTRRQRAHPASASVINWEGVAGMRELKLTLENDLVMPFLEPEVYRKYKVPLPNGILLYGPPGCGKTFVARKLATLIDHAFIEFKPSDLASVYVHGTQEKIGNTFRQAESQSPALLFFDELDAFIPRRDERLSQHYSAEVNEFLSQLNDCSKRNILVIGTTNYLSRVDDAARRPGRFDKKIYVGPPDLEARIEAVRLFMKGRPQDDIDLCALLYDKECHSYADLELIVNEAARLALQSRVPIVTSHFNEVFARTQPSVTQEMIKEMSKE